MVATTALRCSARAKHTPTLLHLSTTTRPFSATTRQLAKNRIFTSIRNEEELTSLLLLSASNRRPLLTLWTASWCPSCKVVAPVVRELVESEGVGEEEGGVGFAEVEFDAPTLTAGGGFGGEGVGMRFMINSIPTLLSFSRQEAQLGTKVTSVEKMKDREFLRGWIREEATRGGKGGAGGGGGGGGGLFGRLFGLGKS